MNQATYELWLQERNEIRVCKGCGDYILSHMCPKCKTLNGENNE